MEPHKKKSSLNNPPPSSYVKHAIGFDITPHEDWQLLSLFQHFNRSVDTLNYVLYREGASIPDKYKDHQRIEIPVNDIALHSSYISYFEFCGALDCIKAVSEAKYIYHDGIYKAVSERLLPEIGYEESLDREKLLEIGSPLVLNVGFPNAPNKSSQLLEALDIPVLVFSEWQEETPLGRAEWVKVIAALTGKEEEAIAKFERIEKEYLRLKSMTKQLSPRPTVICNLPYKGDWYMPGGDSYISNILNDAGAEYLWSDSPGTGGIQVDFEVVYAKGMVADFWINPDLTASIRQITDKDERLADLLSVIKGNVYNCINRIAPNGANDYWESALTRPDIVLKDLIRIFHPQLLPDHDLYYYTHLN